MELFDTEVDSIRTFSADDQRSIENYKKFVFFLLQRVILTKSERQALGMAV